jgi:methionyl-tRNA formyltransferase
VFALFLMGEKGLFALKELIAINKSLISLVCVARDNSLPNDFSGEIFSLCSRSDIPFFWRGENFPLTNDIFIISVAWRWLISHPYDRLVIFHDSILPKYRGFAPLVNMLINGERRIGYSAILGADEYDTGSVIAVKSLPVEYPLKIQDAIDLNMKNLSLVLRSVVDQVLMNGNLIGVPQDETQASYSIWRDEKDYFIDWSKDSVEIQRFIDAVGPPYAGAVTRDSTTSKLYRVMESELIPDVECEIRDVGKVIFSDGVCPVVICGTGLLKITRLCRFGETDNPSCLPLARFRVRFI